MNTTVAASFFSKPASGNQLTLTRQVALAIAGSLLIALASKIQVPFYPIPMTLQTLAILTIGMAYGWRLGTATLILYLLEGAVGLPVLAGTPEKGIGLAYMLGGTGGYLIGFVLAAGCCGWLAERGWDRRILTTAATMLIGNILIYIPGLLWLGALYGWDKPLIEWGLTPFVLGDLTKIALGSCLMPAIWYMFNLRKVR
ncbi:MAG: biotin transporter BioY [Rhodospirillales bacterium]|nr:biotin transporter BioY [Rhodospirillales bacterium]